MKNEIICELDKILPVVERVHGEHHPELHEVAALYAEVRENADPQKLERLHDVTSGFTALADACPTYTYIKAYADLAALAENKA